MKLCKGTHSLIGHNCSFIHWFTRWIINWSSERINGNKGIVCKLGAGAVEVVKEKAILVANTTRKPSSRPHYYILENLWRYGKNWPHYRKTKGILSFFLHLARYHCTCDVLFKLSQERHLLKVIARHMTSNVRRSCNDVDIGLPPPNGHPLFDKVKIDLVNCHRNCDVIKSINMLHFRDVAKRFL